MASVQFKIELTEAIEKLDTRDTAGKCLIHCEIQKLESSDIQIVQIAVKISQFTTMVHDKPVLLSILQTGVSDCWSVETLTLLHLDTFQTFIAVTPSSQLSEIMLRKGNIKEKKYMFSWYNLWELQPVQLTCQQLLFHEQMCCKISTHNTNDVQTKPPHNHWLYL